jgi:hypothetical protein
VGAALTRTAARTRPMAAAPAVAAPAATGARCVTPQVRPAPELSRTAVVGRQAPTVHLPATAATGGPASTRSALSDRPPRQQGLVDKVCFAAQVAGDSV